MAENYVVFFIFLIGTIAVDFLFRFGVSKYIKDPSTDSYFLYILAQKVVSPLNKIIYITGVYFAISSLDLIEATQASFNSIYIVLMLTATAWLGFRVIDSLGCFFAENLLKHEKSSVTYLVPLLTRTLNAILGIIIFVIILQKLGYNVSSILTGLGITGLAVGLAAKDTLTDVLSSFKLILDDVFNLGDFIAVSETLDGEAVQGTVVDISLFSIKLRTLDDTLVVISNHKIADMTVKNFSKRHKFRIDELISIPYDMEVPQVERAVELCREVLKNHPQIEDGFNVYFNKFGDDALKIMLQAHASTTDYVENLEIREEILIGIKKAFDAENIDFAAAHVPGF